MRQSDEMMKKAFIGYFLIAMVLFASFVLGNERGKREAYRHMKVEVDTLYICDSILVDKPVKVTEYKTRIEYIPVPDMYVIDSLKWELDSMYWANCELAYRNDSLMLALQMTQAHYHEDSLYDAWVSGWHPQLDSIRIYDKERVVIQRVTEYEPMKWCIGVTGGVGVGRSGVTPFVGIGVTYSLTSF